jgi:hypothetical protein
MIGRIWWLALAASMAMGTAARSQSFHETAGQAFGDASSKKCCQECCEADCCKEACCKEGCCKEGCCKEGSCKKKAHSARKTVKVVVPVILIPQAGAAPMSVIAPEPVAMPPVPTPAPPYIYCPAGMAHPAPVMDIVSTPMRMPPEPASYLVELKAVESHDGHDDTVSFCPRMTVDAGQRFTVYFDDHEAVLGPCAGCPAKHGSRPCSGATGLGGIVAVQLSGEDTGHVHLELDVQQSGPPQSNKDGVVVLSKGLHAEQSMKLGKPTRLVLHRGVDGQARRWLEVKVSVAGDVAPVPPMPKAGQGPTAWRPAEHLPMPKAYCSEECEPKCCHESGVEDCISGMCEWLGNLCPCTTWVAGQTLPSGHYLQHPPQYFPPSPAFPLTRELASQEALLAAPPPPLPPPVPGPGAATYERHCMQQAVCTSSAPQQPAHGFRVTVDGDSSLQVEGACGTKLHGKDLVLQLPGMSALHLATCGQQVCLHTGTVHARADSLHAEKGVLVLEGHVSMHYSKEAFKSEVHASRIEINPSGSGEFTVKP